MADQKMIQRCQLSSAANCFLNSHREDDDTSSVSMKHPTAAYYDGHNWKSATSVARELEHQRHFVFKEIQRMETQIRDSVERIHLGYPKARKVDPTPKKQEIAQRGSARAANVRAHSQTPFILNPGPTRYSEWPSRFENSHLSEHTGRLGIPVYHEHRDVQWSGEYLKMMRVGAHDKGRIDQRYSVQNYYEHVLDNIHTLDRSRGNGFVLNEMALYWSQKLPRTMAAINDAFLHGTNDKRMRKAQNTLSNLKNIYKRNQLKRKRVSGANRGAKKAQRMANLLGELKKSPFLREQIEQFEYIKERGGDAYLEVKHHLSAVPGYMSHEFKNERLPVNGLWNGIGTGNGVKRERTGSVWSSYDPYGVCSSLRMVSNASSDFQEEYVTKATYGPPTSIHTVDNAAEPMEEESDPDETNLDESDVEDTYSDQTYSDETSSDEDFFPMDLDRPETEESETMED
ncbi:uncharacterized protein EAF02_001454 [Botrytis sinoallii]|uniref:uncharacterized protein n=1 Tax=Botrytis sinoallii TaxID=1463999 RepID=UPI0018FFAD47|nr:uncharacterized protein EAF02_001454 [Botrytis sinoallii]KAF7891129.1 hypothetical protein EAF02_001454 [Botrytis sinoallii]